MSDHQPVLNVAHLTPTFFSPRSVVGGGERYVYYVAQALAAAEASLNATIRQCIFTFAKEEEFFAAGGVPVRVLRNESVFQTAMDPSGWPLWDELARFDLVHIHQSLTNFGAFCTAVAGSLKKKIVLTDLGGGQSGMMLGLRGMELADGVISLSRYAHRLIRSFYQGPHAIIAGPVDTGLFAPGPGVERQRDLVLCVGRVMPHKGFDQVITSLPQELRLVIAGHVQDAGYAGYLRELARNKMVTIVENADDAALKALYRSASLFVQPTRSRDGDGNVWVRSELLGLTTLEAMSCGLPVIVSDAGALPELASDPRFSAVFRSAPELGRLLLDFQMGRWPHPSASGLARANAVANFSYAVTGRRLAEFYLSL